VSCLRFAVLRWIVAHRAAWVVAAILLCTALVAPVCAENHCAGGGKPRPDEGGIGGTGARPAVPDDDDGIGGTGVSAGADTGIIGTITGFASICVGDVEIHYDAASTVEIDGQPAGVADLAVGQVVEVIADGSGDQVRARQIVIRHLVAGPVTAFDAQLGKLDVMGQSVLAPDAQRYDIGQVVRVSGFRRADNAIVASLITIGGESASLLGPVTATGTDWITIGETRIQVPAEARAAVGDEVRVSGRWDGTQLVSTSLETRPRLPFDGRVDRVEVEGFATAVANDQIRVGAFVFDVSSTKPVPLLSAESRVRIQAVIENRRAIIQNMGVLSTRPPRPESQERAPASGKMLDPLGVPGRKPPADPDTRGEHPPRPRDESGPPPAFEGRPEGGAHDMGRPESPNRPERFEHPEKPERPAPPERPPHFERPPLPERLEMPERPPRPDRPDIPRRP
jgi:hypothetical protein